MKRVLALALLLVVATLLTHKVPEGIARRTAPANSDPSAVTPQPTPTQPAPVVNSPFAKAARNVFVRVDKQKRGYISRDDVDRAILQDHAIKGGDAAALHLLRRHFFLLSSGPGITPESIDRVAASPLGPMLERQMKESTLFLEGVNRELYPRGNPMESQAKMRQISQLHRGNCYLLSGIDSQAALDPARLQRMIKDNGVNSSGVRSYTVTFPNAPDEPYTVEDFTDAGLLLNDVESDSGLWLSVIVRAFGQYLEAHPSVRFMQRWFYGLNSRVLPEDLTDQGSMGSDGLRMMSDPKTTRVHHALWELDHGTVRNYTESVVDDARVMIAGWANAPYQQAGVSTVLRVIVNINQQNLSTAGTGAVMWFFDHFLAEPRNEQSVHDHLKHAIVDNRYPATVIKSGGTHEAAILDYRPGTVSADGKHQSKYGFITIRDQAGLSWMEVQKIQSGICWREPGMDGNTICMTVEEFTATYTGFGAVVNRDFP